MAKDLFQIAKAKGIYLTMDLWAMLSPELTKGKSSQRSPKEGSHESERQNDEDSNKRGINP